MEITDFNEINALHKLLVMIKTYNGVNSSDIDLFAGSPFINNILKNVRQEYISAIKSQHNKETIDSWLQDTKFTMDSLMGKAIKTRIQNWDASIVLYLKDKTKDDLTDLSKAYIEPFDYDTQELEKLVEFMVKRLNAT